VLVRLVVLVLVPLVALSLVSADLAVRMGREASSARAVSHDAWEVATRLVAEEDVVVEHSTAMASYETRLSGFSVAQATRILGVDIGALLRAEARRTDRAVARLTPPIARTTQRALGAIRTEVSRGGLTQDAYTDGYDRIESHLGAAADAALRALRAAAASAPSLVVSQVLALEACGDLVQATADEVRDQSAVWFTPGAARAVAADRLAGDMALLSSAGTRLARAGLRAPAKAWRDYATSKEVAAHNRLLTDGALGMPMPFEAGHIHAAPGTVPFGTLIAAYDAIPDVARLISRAVDVTTATARSQMQAVAAHDALDYDLWLALIASAGLVFLTGAVLLALSISRPLRRLESAARAVVAGDLGVGPLAATGPKETATVATAFNALTANLRLLEAKAQALASCDFGNEALAQPLPGPLGASLQDSARVLAGSMHDLDELRERLAYEITHDALSGLPNRAAAIGQLQQTLDRATRRAETTAVLHVDLDSFKRVNDVYGNQAGDHVLREAAARLAGAAGRGAVVARLGGDEFLVVTERVESADEARALGERLVATLSEEVRWNGVALRTGASVGVALCGGEEASASQLLSRADLALEEAKRQGGGRVSLYDRRLREGVARRDEIERMLRAELDHGGGGLVLHYQPVVDTGMQLVEVEALLRWDRAGIGLAGPDEFVPVAEKSDLIIALDNWVLASAVRQLRRWSEDPDMRSLAVAVNVSGRHLMDRTLPPYVARLLSEHEVDPGRLTIEVTETVLLDDLNLAAGELDALQRLGVRVAIDDFGTGYTSLAHLQRLPVDALKIDRTFVSDLGASANASLVRMIIELARHLGLATVSEGVETVEQLDLVTSLGTDCVQGFLVARPMPATALEEWVRVRAAARAAEPLGRVR